MIIRKLLYLVILFFCAFGCQEVVAKAAEPIAINHENLISSENYSLLCMTAFVSGLAFFANIYVHRRVGRRKKSIIINGICFFLLIILMLYFMPTNFRDGKEAFQREDWQGAIDKLILIDESDSKYSDAQKMLEIAKSNMIDRKLQDAKEAFNSKNWSYVIFLLEGFPTNHPNFTETLNMLDAAKKAKETEDLERDKAEVLASQPVEPTPQNLKIWVDCAYLSHIPTGGYCLDIFFSCLRESFGDRNLSRLAVPKENGYYNYICALSAK